MTPFETKTRFVLFIIVMFLLEFFLHYIRNIFLVISSLFVFALGSLSIIFVQEEMNVNPFQNMSVFVQKLPFEISFRESKHIDQDDLASFFTTASFYLTLFTESVRNIRQYIFKKESTTPKNSLRKQTRFVIIGTIVIHSFAFIYLSTKLPNDIVGLFVTFAFFWVICCVSGIFFLKMGPFIEKFHTFLIQIKPITH